MAPLGVSWVADLIQKPLNDDVGPHMEKMTKFALKAAVSSNFGSLSSEHKAVLSEHEDFDDGIVKHIAGVR